MANTASGAVSVTLADNTDGLYTVTSSNAITVANGTAQDNDTITLAGAGNKTVTALVANLSLDATNVGTTGVTTGNASLSITADAAAGNLTVDATALDTAKALTLAGGANGKTATVNNLVADLVATTLASVLTVDLADNTVDSTISITTGTHTTTLSDSAAGDTITVNAAAIADDITLSIAGAGSFTVTALKGDLTSTATGGAISITTADVSTQTIALGSGTTGTRTINATAMTDGDVLTLTGAGAATVSLSTGDLSAGTYTGDLTVTATTGESSIVTGSGNDSVTMQVSAGNIDTINAGVGTDTLVLTGTPAGNVQVDLSISGTDQLTQINGAAETLVQQNFENVDASGMAGGGLIAWARNSVAGIGSLITGSNAANVLHSNDGRDTLVGGSSDDTFVFNAFTDLVTGEVVNGGNGTDTIRLDAGGAGSYDFTTANVSGVEKLAINANEAFTVKLSDNFNANGVGIEVTNISAGGAITSAISIDASAFIGEGLNVSAINFDGNDTFVGTSSADTINAGGGNDTITGGGAADTINAGTGNDTLKFTREQLAAVTTVIAGDGTDTLLLTAATTALVDADFTKFSGVETLQLANGVNTIVLGTIAKDTVGISTIVLGNDNTSITLNNSVAMTIDASALPDGKTLTIAGNGSYTITGLVADLVSTATGTVTTTLEDNGAAVNTTITNNAAAGILTVNSGTFDADDTIVLAGSRAIKVFTGAVSVRINSISTALATVNATAMADDQTLTLSGTGAFNVTGLTANLINTATGTVTVTLANAAAAVSTTVTNNATSGSFTINTGTLDATDFLVLAGIFAMTVVTAANAVAIESTSSALVTVDAGLMTDDQTLTLGGTGAFSVTGLTANLTKNATGNVTATLEDDASAVSITVANNSGTGTLTLDTGTLDSNDTVVLSGNNVIAINAKDDVSITTGTASATVSQIATKTATINAALMSDNNTLTLSGAGAFIVTNLIADLAGSSVTGTINVTAGAGTQVITTGSGNDTITGGAGSDQLIGNGGDDLFLINAASEHDATETITGGDGTDLIRFTITSASTLTLSNLVNVEQAWISSSSGVITGTTDESIDATSAIGSIALYGNDGDNRLTGNSSANLIVAGGGDDTVAGGDGSDTIQGGLGADDLDGGSGNDRFDFASATGVTNELTSDLLVQGGAGTDTIYITQSGNINLDDTAFTAVRGMEALTFTTTGSVGVTFSTNADVAFGTSVTFTASTAGAVTISATSSNLIIDVTGGAAGDSFTTGSKNDVIVGQGGSDIINSGSGSDTVTGGLAVDTIDLGVDTDADTLVVGTVAAFAQDTLTNFRSQDLVKFSTISTYNNFTGNGDLLVDSGFSLVQAMTHIATQLGNPTNNAVGFLLNNDSYLWINKGASAYDPLEDARIRLIGNQTDTLSALGTSNFIA